MRGLITLCAAIAVAAALACSLWAAAHPSTYCAVSQVTVGSADAAAQVCMTRDQAISASERVKAAFSNFGKGY